jgi:hypothetical protein
MKLFGNYTSEVALNHSFRILMKQLSTLLCVWATVLATYSA